MAYKSEKSNLTLKQTKFKEPLMYRVIMHNDDYTTMDFVVFVLIEVFRKSYEEAVSLMEEVHNEGQAKIGVYTRDIAETRVKKVEKLANEYHFPLLCTIEAE